MHKSKPNFRYHASVSDVRIRNLFQRKFIDKKFEKRKLYNRNRTGQYIDLSDLLNLVYGRMKKAIKAMPKCNCEIPSLMLYVVGNVKCSTFDRLQIVSWVA